MTEQTYYITAHPKNRIKVLLLENIHESAAQQFKQEGYQVETFNKSVSQEELITKLHNVSILGIRSQTQINEKILRHANRLIAIGAFCIGTNQINLSACSLNGTAVFNAPYSNTRSVVELAIGEIIMLTRSIFEKSNQLHNGVWNKNAINSHEIRGKKLGIVGYGNIGSQLSVIAESVGMDVYFYDIVEKLALGNAKKCNTLHELLKKCDVITVHIDGNPNNRNLISEKEFNQMKPGTIFLNLSRGFVVNTESLVKAIKNKIIIGAAIDVFKEEPKGNDEPFINELQHIPNVILTPHIAGSTEEAQLNIGEFVSRKIIEYINSGNTYLSCNLPNVQLANIHATHRLLHLHKNVAGMLAQINGILAKNKINILGQHLKTNEEIGYVITDVNKKYHPRVMKELEQIKNTIRLRILY